MESINIRGESAYGWGNWASNFGTTSGTIAQGNDSRINNGQTAYGWGNPSGVYLPIAGTAADSAKLNGQAASYYYPASNPNSYTTLAAVAAVGYVTGTPWSGLYLPLGGGTLTGNLTLSTHNIVTDTTTGTDIGTGATQKVGFFGATPVVQQSATNVCTSLNNLGLTTGCTEQSLSGYAPLATPVFTTNITTPLYIGAGTAANDNPVVGSSYFTTGSWTSTGWTGSGNGPWTNTSTNTTALSFSATCSNATVYGVNLVTSGTYGSGTVTVTFGGNTQTITAVGTIDWYPLTFSTAYLVVTPPGTFTGTIAFTITPLTASTPMIQLNTSGAVDALEVRENSSLGNTFIGLNSGEYNTTGTKQRRFHEWDVSLMH